MKKPWLGSPHGVLPIAEILEPTGDEVLEGTFRILRRDGPVELFQSTGMAGEALIHHCDHLLGGGIGRKTTRREMTWRPLFAEAFAVLAIKVPCSALRLAFGHQHRMALPHFAIEELHPQLFASLCMGGKLGMTAKKMSVFPHFQRDALYSCGRLKLLTHSPLTRLYDDPFFGTQERHGFC